MTTLGYAILGLLAREALSGYDLTQRMKGRVGYFWSARHSQIYPELVRLEDGGFVTHSVVEQRDRPDKKVHVITDAGLEALKDWVTQPPPEKPTRDELTLKAYSAWLADEEEVAGVFRAEGIKHEEQLARYEEIQSRMEDEWREDLHDTRSPRFASYATLRRGIIHERGYAEWCLWLAEAVSGEVQASGRSEA